MKRLLAPLLALMLIFSLSVPALAYSGVPSWAETEFALADGRGVVPDILAQADMSGSITRREFCHTALTLYELVLGESVGSGLATPFSDVDDSAVTAAQSLGIVGGYPDGSFHPEASITRQELFKMLGNLMSALGINLGLDDTARQGVLMMFPDEAEVASWALNPTADLLALGVVGGTDIGGMAYIDPSGTCTRVQAVLMAYRFTESVFISDAPAEEAPSPPVSAGVLTPGTALTTWGRSADTNAKKEYVFGTATDWKYTSAEQALEHMVWVTIPTWTLMGDGSKASSHQRLRVNEAVADTVVQIFTEIYEGKEQFPIKDVGGYDWRGDNKSEHNWGLAIDINWNENYYISLSSGAQTGECWLPGENPYSIPADGEVVAIFHKYGFGWGGDGWWTSVRDYMHFSFMST